jgi:hypothetical protein
MSEKRTEIIDIYRGVVIFDMIVMHLIGTLPKQAVLFAQIFDFAIEGFIFLSGFMIGWHYFPRYLISSRETNKRLLMRGVKILLIQYLLIISVSIPFCSYMKLKSVDEIVFFSISSFLFLNQVPIIHILPTFIPLFLLSPLILRILAGKGESWLMLASIGIFLLGAHNPFMFSFGENPIFPVILWQIYFVAGCVLGKIINDLDITIDPVRLLCVATILFIASILMKYGSYFDAIRAIKVTYDIYPKKYPLNIYGVIYGTTMLLFVYAITATTWRRIGKESKYIEPLALLGRHSLAVFVLHVYVVYGVSALVSKVANGLVVFLGVAIMLTILYLLLLFIDKKSKAGSLPSIYRWLFA